MVQRDFWLVLSAVIVVIAVIAAAALSAPHLP
jgi:uncharacterized protein involved in exopolysaccharide biosynthesis